MKRIAFSPVTFGLASLALITSTAVLTCSPAPNQSAARRKAAEIACDFKCGQDDVKVIGASGRAVEMAKR